MNRSPMHRFMNLLFWFGLLGCCGGGYLTATGHPDARVPAILGGFGVLVAVVWAYDGIRKGKH